MKILNGIVGTLDSEKGFLALLVLGVCSFLILKGVLTSIDFRYVILGTVGMLFTSHTVSDIMGGNDSDKPGLNPFNKGQ